MNDEIFLRMAVNQKKPLLQDSKYKVNFQLKKNNKIPKKLKI